MLKPGGDVHAIAVDGSVLLPDHIAQVDADAKLHAPVLGQLVVALGEFVLDFVGAVHGFDGAGKLSQDAVAGGVDESPAVGLDALAEKCAGVIERAKGGGFVIGHQPRVAGGVGGEDGGEFAVGGHLRYSPESGAQISLRPRHRVKASPCPQHFQPSEW